MPRRPAPGFTLIELLTVVAILSAASLLAFGAFGEDRAQIRYDDTRNRLQALRRAILGHNGPAVADSLGGFVADNGGLPADLDTLLQAGSLVAQGVLPPLFDPQPDSAGCATGGGDTVALADAAAVLVKGHRGDYLGGLAVNGRFRDGWGNAASGDDALNFGWAASLAGKQLSITSLGADNEAGGADFAADQGTSVKEADWTLPLQGWTVRVYNYSGADLAAQKLSVSLLAFRNDAGGGQWLRYSTPVAEVCLDGDGDGLVGGTPCAQSAAFSFAANCKAGDAASGDSRVAQGQHLLLVTGHASSTLWQASDSAEWTAGKSSFARVRLAAGLLPPETRLELR